MVNSKVILESTIVMDDILKRLDSKKKRLQQLSAPKEQLVNLQEWYKVELTYTSNALEGNTLDRRQTALIVGKNLSVAGKSLTEHLEAVNHAQAVDYIWQFANKTTTQDVDAKLILAIHHLVLDKIDSTNAGRLRRMPVRVAGSATVFPNWRRVSSMLDEMVEEIGSSKAHICLKASQAHLQLVSIHPFVDGNGPTARLLMNLLLLQDGWPPAVIRKEDRLTYLRLLENIQTKGATESFHIFILRAIERSLDSHLQPDSPAPAEAKLLKIGELARLSEEPVSTLRYWTDQGLLPPADMLPSKYRLYAPSAVKRAKRIRQLQNQRFTLAEIKNKLG